MSLQQEQLRREKDMTRKYRTELNRRPFETTSRVLSVAVQSVRKQAAEHVETVCDQQEENIREAEDEIRRDQEQIDRAEAALAVVVAERDVGAAQIAKLNEEFATLRSKFDSSKAEALCLQEERAKLDGELAAKTARSEDVEKENASLKNQLNDLRVENGRLKGEFDDE